MQAAYIDELGPPEKIRYGTLDDPRPGPTDVLVETVAVSVNPVDTFVRSGVFRTPLPFPFVIGRDLVGRVAETGPGAAGFAPGDLVWCNSLGHGGRQGAAADRAVIAADRLYHLPAGVDPMDAVAVVHLGGTAHLALFRYGGLRPGRTVLVGGGAGHVGGALVAMAAEAGARVIATARPGDARYCRSLGAAEVLDYAAPDLPDRVRELAPAGVDLLLDTSGTNDLETAVPMLAPGGRIVLLAGTRTRPVLPAGELYLKDGSIVGFVISRATSAELAEAAVDINRLLAAGLLRPRALRTLSLADAAEAHRLLEDGGARGRRLVLKP